MPCFFDQMKWSLVKGLGEDEMGIKKAIKATEKVCCDQESDEAALALAQAPIALPAELDQRRAPPAPPN